MQQSTASSIALGLCNFAPVPRAALSLDFAAPLLLFSREQSADVLSLQHVLGYSKAKIAKALFCVGIIAALIETRVSSVFLTIPRKRMNLFRGAHR